MPPAGHLCASLALALASAAGAAELTPVRAFRSFDRATAPELPESIVVDLVQDRDGILWVDTIGGLATYDGAALRAVTDPQAPRGAALIVARGNGGLYALSRQGLHLYDGRWTKLATDRPVYSLAESDAASLWVVRGDALWTTPTAAVGSTWTPVALPAAFGVPRSVFSDRAGGVYVASEERLLRCKGTACAAVATGLVPARGSTALAARDGSLWIGTWDGRLFVARPGGSEWTAADLGGWPSGGVRSLAEGLDGRVWVGGMARLCSGTAEGAWACWGAENGLPSSAILSLLADREGTLWLGLNGRGVMQWVGQGWTHLTRWPGARDGARLDVVSVVPTHDGRGLLASVFGQGVLRWDGARVETWGKADGLADDVRGLAEPAPGIVWAAARHGIYEKNGAGRFRRTLDVGEGFVSGFANDADGQWFAYTEAEGIFVRRGASWVDATDLEALAGTRGIRAMGFTPSGVTWIATPRELVLRTAAGAVERFALGLERGRLDTVTTLVEVAPGTLWAGGQGGAAVVKDGAFRLLPDGDVPGNVYFLRRAPDGAVWMGGSRGVARVKDGVTTRWDRSKGLVDDECNGAAVVMADGTLYAATAGSLARYDARATTAARPPLRVLWQDPAARTGTIEKAASERRVALDWHAPTLVPEPVWYQARLGNDWSAPTREPRLTLESLPQGTTEVAVRARRSGDPAGTWSEPTALRIRVAPFWWETTAARIAFGASLLGAMLLAAQQVVRRAHARKAEALVHLRADFVASASHELRTPIAQIRLFADMLRLGRVRSDAERDDALDTIHRATRRLETLADNLVQVSTGDEPPVPTRRSIDIAEALKEVAADLAPMAAAKGARLRVEAKPGIQAEVDAEGLQRIVSNLTENALKYGPNGQTVTLKADRNEQLELAVEDEGPGIPEAERARVFERFERLARDRNSAVSGTGLGLAVVKEAVSQAGGTVHIEETRTGGARVVITLPQPETNA